MDDDEFGNIILVFQRAKELDPVAWDNSIKEEFSQRRKDSYWQAYMELHPGD